MSEANGMEPNGMSEAKRNRIMSSYLIYNNVAPNF